jgi:hypothetical protein
MQFPSKEVVERIRKEYPIGTRVELVRMDDPQAPPVGTLGTVKGVDDIGSIMVSWDNGSSLSVAFGEDACQVVPKVLTDRIKDQILKVRDTGKTNMFDIPAVQRIAFDLECFDLVIFLEDHRKEYTDFIMTGVQK